VIRKAFLMTLRPGCREEYERRHNPVWPEMEEVLRRRGVRNYSIFHKPGTDILFAYVEVESEELWLRIADTEECRRWWAYMKDLMLTEPDDSPVSETLEQVFHLD
jgi:L-rhamnose mutarotase